LSRRPEYRPEEGATHRQQSILKPEHFQISVIHRKGRLQMYLVGKENRLPKKIRFKRLSEKAIIPTKGSRLAAGHDLYGPSDGILRSGRQLLVDTGVAVGLPRGTYGRITARSGMASKQGIAVGRAVIDADYTGELK